MMKKNNVILISAFVLIVAIILIVTIVNRKPMDNTLKIEDVQKIEQDISSGKKITLSRFEDFMQESARQEGNYNIYRYNVNDKYRVEVVEKEERVVAIKVINKVSEKFVELYTDSLEQFLLLD